MNVARIPVIGPFKPAILREMSKRSVLEWINAQSSPSAGSVDLPPLVAGATHSARLNCLRPPEGCPGAESYGFAESRPEAYAFLGACCC